MLVYGKNACKDYIKKNKALKVYLDKNFNDGDILKYLKGNIKYVDKSYLDKLSNNGLHQGIVIEVQDYEYVDVDELIVDDGLVVILDHLEDPHNFGAIIRTCEALGVTGIIIPKDRSVLVNPTVIKTSAGTADSVKIAMVTNLNDTILRLKKNGYWIVGTDMDGTCYSAIDYKGKCAIVVGNEGHGISSSVLKNCDFVASIPMSGNVNSLNASVAFGIVLSAAVLNRNE